MSNTVKYSSENEFVATERQPSKIQKYEFPMSLASTVHCLITVHTSELCFTLSLRGTIAKLRLPNRNICFSKRRAYCLSFIHCYYCLYFVMCNLFVSLLVVVFPTSRDEDSYSDSNTD